MSRLTKAQKEERAQAIVRLREMIEPGDTVYTILRRVSRSGMSREVSVMLLSPDERPGKNPVVDLHPNYLTATALGRRQGKSDGIIMDGGGMDMGFALVYELSSVLFPKGFGCFGEGCPSNDHSNEDSDYTPHVSKSGRKSRSRVCPRCKGEGTTERMSFGSLGETVKEECRTCHGEKRLGPGHWHRDGGYALQQRWI